MWDRQCATRSASRLCCFTSKAACSPSNFGPIRGPFLPDSVGDRPVLNEPVEFQAWSEFKYSPRLNANARNKTVLASRELVITLWYNSHPLHREFLNGEKQRAEIASLDFHIV
jgi:hypothetical protein